MSWCCKHAVCVCVCQFCVSSSYPRKSTAWAWHGHCSSKPEKPGWCCQALRTSDTLLRSMVSFATTNLRSLAPVSDVVSCQTNRGNIPKCMSALWTVSLSWHDMADMMMWQKSMTIRQGFASSVSHANDTLWDCYRCYCDLLFHFPTIWHDVIDMAMWQLSLTIRSLEIC